MPRIRVAVALLVPDPAATEIDGLRRGLDDPGLAKVVPHITIIPPVNVSVERVPEVLALLRAAAAATEPMSVRLGPPTTFEPVSPVVYLGVHADDGPVHELRAALLAGPLARPAVYEFVPHVTICDECPPVRAAGACAALADYEVDVMIDRVHLLRDHAPGPRRWNPVADVWFQPSLVVGTGGMPTEISVSALGDPEANPHFGDAPTDVPAGADPIVVVARREREVVAAARGWASDGALTLDEIVGDLDLERQLLRAATRAIAGRA